MSKGNTMKMLTIQEMTETQKSKCVQGSLKKGKNLAVN